VGGRFFYGCCLVSGGGALGVWCGQRVWLALPGHAASTSVYARLGHPWPRTVPEGQDTPAAGKSVPSATIFLFRTRVWHVVRCLRGCCLLTGPCAAGMPHASLQGCI